MSADGFSSLGSLGMGGLQSDDDSFGFLDDGEESEDSLESLVDPDDLAVQSGGGGGAAAPAAAPAPPPAAAPFTKDQQHITNILHADNESDLWCKHAHEVAPWLVRLSELEYKYINKATGRDLAAILLRPDRADFFFDAAGTGQAAAANSAYTVAMKNNLRALLMKRIGVLSENKRMALLVGTLEYLNSGSAFLTKGLEEFCQTQNLSIGKVIFDEYQKLPSLQLKIQILEMLLEKRAKIVFSVLNTENRGRLIESLTVWIGELSQQDRERFEQLLEPHRQRYKLEGLAKALVVERDEFKRREIRTEIGTLCKAKPSLQPTKQTITIFLKSEDRELWTCVAHHLLAWLQDLSSFGDDDISLRGGRSIDRAGLFLMPAVAEWLFEKRQQAFCLGAMVNPGYTQVMQDKLAKALVCRFVHPALSKLPALMDIVLSFMRASSKYLLKRLDNYLCDNGASILQVFQADPRSKSESFLSSLLFNRGLYVCVFAECLSVPHRLVLIQYLQELVRTVSPQGHDVLAQAVERVKTHVDKLASDEARRAAAAAAAAAAAVVMPANVVPKRIRAGGGGGERGMPAGGVLNPKRARDAHEVSPQHGVEAGSSR